MSVKKSHKRIVRSINYQSWINSRTYLLLSVLGQEWRHKTMLAIRGSW